MLEKNDVGKTVSYWDDGWRYGKLVDIIKNDAIIKPIGPLGKKPQNITISLQDTKNV